MTELEQLRESQARAMDAYRGPIFDWYHKQGAWMGMCDALAEECLILQEEEK